MATSCSSDPSDKDHTEHGDTFTAGEVSYLHADSSNTFVADEDTEMAYVASPPATYAAHVAASGPSADGRN
ncbi:hypothetical protein [Nocardia brasiliensis]|uniref:hypothetical protein n=1 Tax=Nocardia brasiliensis TaxID=37326 RepID=UPI00366E340E